MEFVVTPYRICTSIFIKVYRSQQNLAPRENGKICLFIIDIIRQNEYSFRQLNELVETNCSSPIITGQFRKIIDDCIVDINNLFELVKQIRDPSLSDDNSVSGLYLRKLAIYFERLKNQACSKLYDDIIAYVSSSNSTVRRRGQSITWQTPRTTRSSGIYLDSAKNVKPIYHINHEISRLQANELRAMNPKDLYDSLRRPHNSCKSDATFLRYLNLLRVNESVGSKHLLMAYFDMVSDSVSRSYSALNHAIWYLHHGQYKRAIECLQECYCCAQAADDDKCLLIALMWLARIVIQAKQKNSSKYNVTALLELVRKRSHKAGLPYVQAMTSMALEQLTGPVDDSGTLKKYSEVLKEVASNTKQNNHLMINSNQPNPLDKEDEMPSAEILAVRNSMNDVLAMYYGLLSAHLTLIDANQSSALTSQVLLHLDLIEKCGNEDVFLVNENLYIAIRNIAFHVWNTTRDIQLVREILVDLCSNNMPIHRTDNHSIWRQALSEISFEYYMEHENWSEASKMIAVIRETDGDSAQLRQSELLRALGDYEEALNQVDDLIMRIDHEESCLNDSPNYDSNSKLSNGTKIRDQTDDKDHEDWSNLLDSIVSGVPCTSPFEGSHSLSIEHKSFMKSKALLLQATLLQDETKLLESLHYATQNRFVHVRTACLMQLADRYFHVGIKSDKLMESVVIDIFSNGTMLEKRQLRELLKSR